jgi:multimeric flavodoxin WrbA
MKVIGVVTSPRYIKITSELFSDILNSDNILDTIYNVAYEGRISNSEALLLASMWGSHKEGIPVELVYPGDKIPDFDGVVLSSPVYFGDRSSNLHDFIKKANLKNKAVGSVSCGAKRNGGQETTNIYALYDCLDKGALITGNGPPTAQYGGTGWAGNKTAIANDDFGIKTSYGTGRQVAKLTKLINSSPSPRKPNIVFIVVTEDQVDFSFIDYFKNSNIRIVDITKKNIRRCVACPVCPNGDLTKDYKCVITNDEMKKVWEPIVKADCVIFVSGTDDRNFQVFIERTRFIRRDHFELSERLYSSISKTISITDILPLRIMTNMLRQNMFGLPFFKDFNGYQNTTLEKYASIVEFFTRKSITMRKFSGTDFRYDAVGYEDAKINEKAYRD